MEGGREGRREGGEGAREWDQDIMTQVRFKPRSY